VARELPERAWLPAKVALVSRFAGENQALALRTQPMSDMGILRQLQPEPSHECLRSNPFDIVACLVERVAGETRSMI
jgi:hypothetical protein